MTRFDKLRRMLLILAAPVLLFACPYHLDAFPVQTFFVDVNGDGRVEQVELFSEGTQNSIAVHLSRSTVSVYHFEAPMSPFGSVLAGDFDHDGDLDLVWLTGGGPGSVLLHNDGHGNFRVIDNTHLYASELRLLIDGELNSGLEAQRSDVAIRLFTFSNHSKDLTSTPAWYAADCILYRFLMEDGDHSVWASPQYRLAGRSPPQPSLFCTPFSS